MRIIDISMTISPEMPVYKNQAENKPLIRTVKSFESANSFESSIMMNLHTGTHIDAPLHMIENGKQVGEYDLQKLICQCSVLDLTGVPDSISANDLQYQPIKPGYFILLKTQNSFSEQFRNDFIYLERTGAEFLKTAGVCGVGLDSLGIERNQPDHDSHKILFEAGIVILEGLQLKDASPGEYLLITAPIKIKGVEAAPVRAVLISDIIFN